MNPITAIIEGLLDAHRDDGTHSNPELARAIASMLTEASWKQLAAVTGGSVEHDIDGQIVLYTGCYASGAEQVDEDPEVDGTQEVICAHRALNGPWTIVGRFNDKRPGLRIAKL
jgi:hypothetical protein